MDNDDGAEGEEWDEEGEVGEPDSLDIVGPVAPWLMYDRKYSGHKIPFYEDPRYEVDVLKAVKRALNLDWEGMARLATGRQLSYRDIGNIVSERVGRIPDASKLFTVSRVDMENWIRPDRVTRPESCRDARHICEKRLGIVFTSLFCDRQLNFSDCGLGPEAYAVTRGPVNKVTACKLLDLRARAEEPKVRERYRSLMGFEMTSEHWASMPERTFRKH